MLEDIDNFKNSFFKKTILGIILNYYCLIVVLIIISIVKLFSYSCYLF